MQIIKTRINVKPENKDEFASYLQHIAGDVQREHSGCIQFELLSVINNGASFVLYEEWKSEDEFFALRQSDLFKQIGQKVIPMLLGKMEMTRFVAEAVSV